MKLGTAKKRERPRQFIVEEKEKKRSIFRRLTPLFIFIFIVLIISSFFIWYKFKPRAIGVLYNKTYAIASKRNAFVKEIHVGLGDKVKKNQSLVKLDTNTLESEKKVLQTSVIISKENIVSKTADLKLKQEELNLKLDDNLIFRSIDIQAARSELNEDMAILHSTKEQIKGLEIELDRKKKLVKKDVVAQSVLDKIEADYNSLQKIIKHYEKVVNSDETWYKTATDRYNNYKEKNYRVPVSEILRPLKEKVKQAESALQVVESKIFNSILKSPIDGYVSYIEKREGSGVRAGETIITVKDYNKNIVVAYVREPWVKYFKLGDTLSLYSRSSTFNGVKGKIVKISPDVMFIPTEFLNKYEDIKEKGIRILIELEKPWDGYDSTTFDIERYNSIFYF